LKWLKLEPFYLERWLLNPCKYDLASGGITKLKLGDLITEIDFNMVMSYGITNGSNLIRQEIAELFSSIDENGVLVTSGTAEANLLALYRLLERGDELVVLLPAYMQFIGLAKSMGAKAKACYLQEDVNYKLDLEDLKELVTKKTKVIGFVNPNNPIGSILSDSEVRAICEVAEDVGAWVICDGALRGLEIEGNPSLTPVEMYEKGICTGSLSKIGLTGLRIGWLVADEGLVEECWAYKDYTTLCHSGIGEYLATIALRRENMARFFKRAKEIIRTHSAILGGWISENSPVISWFPSKAGHTSFVRFDLDIDSEELCKRLLKEEGVLLGPGAYFGSEKHLRVRYSCEKEALVEGLKRFSAFLKRLQKQK